MNRAAIIFVVDRLGAGFLGPYGNTWVETPNFNRLAAEALLLENLWVDSPQLDEAYRAYWTGRHLLEPDGRSGSPNLIRLLTGNGAATSLVTDEPLVAEHPLAADFSEQIRVSGDPPRVCASDIEGTQLAKVFSAAVEVLQQQQGEFLLWVHARGMQGPWDAPLELRRSLAAEDDPPPPDDVAVPSLRLSADHDPDELLGLVQSYAGQVMLLDTCLGVLMDCLHRHPQRENLLLIVTSPRGFPLGEHLVVGDCEASLYGELLHVPLFLWRGDAIGAAAREHVLVQPADAAATLLDWFAVSGEGLRSRAWSLLPLTEAPPEHWPRDRAISVAPGQRAIRTPAWFLRESFSATREEVQGSRCELFRKPDDRWEANEIADRCPHIVEQLRIAMEEFEQAAASVDGGTLNPLTEELMSGIE